MRVQRANIASRRVGEFSPTYMCVGDQIRVYSEQYSTDSSTERSFMNVNATEVLCLGSVLL